MNTCTHWHTHTDIATRGFVGPVYTRHITDEDPVAHGNVCVTVECSACGARREENRNAGHVEVSAWGDDYEDRAKLALILECEAAKIRETVREASATLVRGDAEVTVAICDDGMLWVEGAHSDADLPSICAAAPGVVSAAKNLRSAVVAAEKARAEVRS